MYFLYQLLVPRKREELYGRYFPVVGRPQWSKYPHYRPEDLVPSEGGCASKNAAAYGKPTQEQVSPEGLQPAQERQECEGVAERKSSVWTVISSTRPVPLGKREESGLEHEKVKRKCVS